MTNLQVPESAAAPCDYKISAGECIYRCHSLDFAGTDFNPGIGQSGRFTPLVSSVGQNIHTLYAAKSFDAAVYETLLRKESATQSSIFSRKFNAMGVTSISVQRDLFMVRLFTPELRRWNIDEGILFSSQRTSFIACRALAANIWRDNSWADGIVWCSQQDSESHAYLLFGDRCSDGDLLIQKTLAADSDSEFLRRITKAARMAGIRIVGGSYGAP